MEKQKNAALSNTSLTEAGKAAINEKYAKQEADIKLAAWQADKDAKLEQALINGALAITKTFAELGWPAGIIGAAAAAVETGVQVAQIESQKPPQFASGGILQGPSHAGGGIPLINGHTGEHLAEVEGGEAGNGVQPGGYKKQPLAHCTAALQQHVPQWLPRLIWATSAPASGWTGEATCRSSATRRYR